MLIINRINQSFTLFFRIFWVNVSCDFRQNSSVKVLCNNLPVEIFNIKIKFIVKQFAIRYFAGYRII